jgi:hypothetical protein
MRKPLLRFPDPSFLIQILITALLLAGTGCSRGEDYSSEDEREYDPRKTVISRDRRRETPAPPSVETQKPAIAQKPSDTDTNTKEVISKPNSAAPKADMDKQAAQAAKMVDAGLRLWDEAKDAMDKGEQGIADGLLMQAYSKLEQAHRLYENLNKHHLDTPFSKKLQAVEKHMYDIQKAIGTGDW